MDFNAIIKIINKIIDTTYKNPIEVFEQIDDFLKEMVNIVDILYKNNLSISGLDSVLFQLEKAIQNKDVVIICDLLQYEIKPIMQELMENSKIG